VKPCIAVCTNREQHYNDDKRKGVSKIQKNVGEVISLTDLERFVVCPEADAWYILQPNWEATTKLHASQ